MVRTHMRRRMKGGGSAAGEPLEGRVAQLVGLRKAPQQKQILYLLFHLAHGCHFSDAEIKN